MRKSGRSLVNFGIKYRRSGQLVSQLVTTTSNSGTTTTASSTTPIIPRIRTICPFPTVQPHPGIVIIINDIKCWSQELASRSMLDDQMAEYLEAVDNWDMWDAGCVYPAFTQDPNGSYTQLFEMTKAMMFTQFIDDLIAFSKRRLVDQELFNYLANFVDNPELVHDASLDPKRNYFINLAGHCMNGLRAGGCSPMQIRRLAKALTAYIWINVNEQRPELDWDNYWSNRFINALVEVLSIPAEAVVGIETIPQTMANDPGVKLTVDLSRALIIVANDLGSYLRERVTDEAAFNHVSFLAKQCGLDEQSAVDRCCEQLVCINRQWVTATRSTLRSPIARQHPQLELYLKHVVPRTTFGCLQAVDLLSRNRIDKKRPDYTQGKWTCDDAFVNDSDHSNVGQSFKCHLKKFANLNIWNQEFL